MAAAHVIADSSIWIDHLNKGDAALAAQLKRRRIALHPMIIGEVASGSIAKRRLVLEELQALPQAPAASHAEVMAMIEWLELFNQGIGYVDAHLLAAARQLPTVCFGPASEGYAAWQNVSRSTQVWTEIPSDRSDDRSSNDNPDGSGLKSACGASLRNKPYCE